MTTELKSSSKINPHILGYIEMVESGKVQACEEQHLLVALVRKCFGTEDIYVNDEQLNQYLSLIKYFPYDRLFKWEEFCLALHCCTYKRKNGMPRWPDLFAEMGRGGGKDGYIAFESFCLMSEYNGIMQYDVDICANNEDQARAPFDDVYDVLEDPKQTKKLRKFFHWNKEEIVSLKTKSKLKYRTNSPKGKDGLRSGAVIFNEIHQYEDYANINVFTTGLGKKKHPRRTYATTNGDVRDGPLDHLIERSMDILKGIIPDNGMLPFICKLNKKEDVHNPKLWEMANPSLPYRPDLMEEMKKEYDDWKLNPSQFSAFMTKRMNIPDGNSEIQVTDWENIIATNQEIPDLTGRNAVVGIDFAKVSDFASAVIHIREADKRYDIGHSWLCAKSPDIPRMKCPWKEWAERGLLTVVDDVEINPDLITEWIAEQGAIYNLIMLAIDNFRYDVMSRSLRNIGFDAKEFGNVKLIRPSDVMKVSPIIDRCFVNHFFVWGDNPPMRWATNNTKMIRTGINKETGNLTYGKIEGKSRKTDPFMAVVAAMVIEEELGDSYGPDQLDDFEVAVY
jgi:phage terminase large subunit-like protein